MTARPTPDLSLYLVLDPAVCGARAVAEVVEAAASGGVTIVQLRDKTAGTRTFVERAREVRARLVPRRVPFLINDRVDVALAAGAEGVHLGQSDMDSADARRLLGPGAIIGLTVRSLAEAAAVPRGVIDYVSIGGVFPTASKNNPKPPIGLDGLARIAREIETPLVAISGIEVSNAAAVVAAGVEGVAVASAICRAPDPAAASTALLSMVRQARRQGRRQGRRSREPAA